MSLVERLLVFDNIFQIWLEYLDLKLLVNTVSYLSDPLPSQSFTFRVNTISSILTSAKNWWPIHEAQGKLNKSRFKLFVCHFSLFLKLIGFGFSFFILGIFFLFVLLEPFVMYVIRVFTIGKAFFWDVNQSLRNFIHFLFKVS